MDQIHNIRFRFFEKGENISQIADAMNLDWKTVKKYVDMKDFNEPASDWRFCPKLDLYKEMVDQWLEEDKNALRKQRHTAKRVYNRLCKEIKGFKCSYRTVASYYKEKRKEVFSNLLNGFLPLEHHHGEAQVDLRTAQFYENGKCIVGKYLEVSFPCSNKGYLQLFYGENMECLLEGLDAIFRHIGCVPAELQFDNTRTIVTEVVRGGGRSLTQKFERFREHYRFKAIFMNPGEGNGKYMIM